MKLHVANLPYSAPSTEVEDLFAAFGEVTKVHLVSDGNGRPRGFGFIHFVDADEAIAARDALDGQEFQGRSLRVTVAEKQDGPRPWQRERDTQRQVSEPEVVIRRRRPRAS